MTELVTTPHRTSGAVIPPILRWAGGKRWLAPKIRKIAAARHFRNYHEPFLGGGAVFFALGRKSHSYLADTNAQLIETYSTVRDQPSAVARGLSLLENSSSQYYELRASEPHSIVERATRFIYLNHHSFNGIYRENLSGRYNVPYGNRSSPAVPDSEQLLAASALLKGAEIKVADFEESLAQVKRGDLVFLDPPYTVANDQRPFVKYNKNPFSFADQERLAAALIDVDTVGAHFIMTNAFHESIDELYDLGFARHVVSRRNSIGGMSARRGTAKELLFTNLPAVDLGAANE